VTDARQSAEWAIGKVKAEAEHQGDQLTEAQENLLRTDIRTLGRVPSVLDLEDTPLEMHPLLERAALQALNNQVVNLVRAAIERDKASGAPVIKVRRGLRVPTDWAEHYNRIHAADASLPWVLGGILQNAMLQNPFAGERRPWRSR
jgi:hypothetical protein